MLTYMVMIEPSCAEEGGTDVVARVAARCMLARFRAIAHFGAMLQFFPALEYSPFISALVER